MTDDDTLLDHAYMRDNYLAVGFGALLRDVLAMLNQQAGTNLAAIQDALAHRDWATLAEQGHSLKGSAGSVGANLLAAEAEQLEEVAPSGDMTVIAPLVAQLARTVARTQAAIAAELTAPDRSGSGTNR